MSQRTSFASAVGPCRVLVFVLGLSLGLQAPAAPVPKGKVVPRGKVVENWSLSLSLGSDKMVEGIRDDTTVTVTLRNHAEKGRTIQQVRVLEGNLNLARGLSYVVRFKNGDVIEVPSPSNIARRGAGVPPLICRCASRRGGRSRRSARACTCCCSTAGVSPARRSATARCSR
jgi:hypothetical protein